MYDISTCLSADNEISFKRPRHPSQGFLLLSIPPCLIGLSEAERERERARQFEDMLLLHTHTGQIFFDRSKQHRDDQFEIQPRFSADWFNLSPAPPRKKKKEERIRQNKKRRRRKRRGRILHIDLSLFLLIYLIQIAFTSVARCQGVINVFRVLFFFLSLSAPDISIHYVRLAGSLYTDACSDSMCNGRPVLFSSAADEEHTLSGPGAQVPSSSSSQLCVTQYAIVSYRTVGLNRETAEKGARS